jgi:hypothetical protein
MIDPKYWMQIQPIADLARWNEQAVAKHDILNKVLESFAVKPRSILFTAFNPVIMCFEREYDCTVTSSQPVRDSWQSTSTYVESIADCTDKYDVVFALDEYLTYANTEQDQRDALAGIKDVLNPGGHVITTCQDYKNSAPHKRHQVECSTHHHDNDYVIVDQNIWDKNNKQNWVNYIYMIENHGDLTVLGPTDRRTMYFKQLAKYSSDLQGYDYVIQKNLLYRGFFKKHFEHIISVRF